MKKAKQLTQDETLRLQRACSEQDEIVLARGVHRCTRTLTLSRPGQRLYGLPGAVLLFDSPDGEAIRVTARDVSISGIVMKNTAVFCENTGIAASGVKGLSLTDLAICGFETGVRLHRCARSFVSGCCFWQARVEGMAATFCRRLQLTECRFQSNGWMRADPARLSGFCNTGVALRLAHASEVTMSRCAFVHNARALWATDVERLVGVGCVDDDQVRDSVIYGSAEFIGGIGFDEESIFLS